MLCVEIESGALYYGEAKQREAVTFTPELREELFVTVKSMREMYGRKYTPKANTGKRCQNCSMKDVCLPALGNKTETSVRKYMEANLE